MRGIPIVAIVVALAVAVRAQTPAEEIVFDASVDSFDALLNDTHNAMIALLDGPANTGCTIDRSCGAGARALPSNYSVDFSRPIPASTDFVQAKLFTPSVPLTTNLTAEFCAMNALKPTWIANRQKAGTDVLFQYYATRDDEFAVYPPTPWNCSAAYTPSERPYYVAGATGQKDVVILIDVSDSGNSRTTRIEYEIAAAVKLLKTLSFRDYVAVLPFSDYASTAITVQLVQATARNVARLIGNVTNLARDPASKPNPGGAVREAAKMLSAGKAADLSSGCAQTIVLLSNGFNDFPADEPYKELAPYPDIIAFAYFVVPGGANAQSEMLQKLACLSNGLVATIASLSDAPTAVLNFNQYFATLIQNPVVRWSEYYRDAFGQGDILSGALPVYRDEVLQGLAVMDIPLRNLSLDGALTGEQVNTLLLSRQACTPLEQRGSGASIVKQLQGSTCAGVEADVAEEVTARKLKGLWVFLSVVGVLLMLSLPMAMYRFCGGSPADVKNSAPGLLAIAALSTIVWVVLLSLFWAQLFDNVVDITTFEKVTYKAIRHEENPYRCCDVDACSCTQTSAPDCAVLLGALEEGTCGGGYQCCRKTCRSCNCRRKKKGGRSCSRCCSCRSSVSNRRCTVVCGTCYRPTITVAYEYGGKTLNSRLVFFCGRNDTACPGRVFGNAPLGQDRTGYVDPQNPYDLRTELKLKKNYLIPIMMFFAAGIFLTLAGMACAVLKSPGRRKSTASSVSSDYVKMTNLGSSSSTSSKKQKHELNKPVGGSNHQPAIHPAEAEFMNQQPVDDVLGVASPYPVSPYGAGVQTSQPDYAAGNVYGAAPPPQQNNARPGPKPIEGIDAL